MIRGKRSKIKDDNNYIAHEGKITFVCEKCGHITSRKIHITEREDKTKNEGGFLCDSRVCKGLMVQVDNSMGEIYKTLVKKGYRIERCCEGHWAEGKHYNVPYIYLYGNVKDIRPLIPSSFYNKFHIGHIIGRDITCITYNYLPYINYKKEFIKVKEEGLELLTYLVKALPKCPLSYNQAYFYKENFYK